jgi:Tol biopolymer transport system component
VKKSTTKFWLQRLLYWSLVFALIAVLGSCTTNDIPLGTTSLNSRYTEEQPALSGNGRFLAFVSNFKHSQQLVVYDLQEQKFIPTPGLNPQSTVAESPSLSYTGRYIAYLKSDQGRPVIALYDRTSQQSQILTLMYRYWLRNPSISPDGRYIVFESASGGQWDIEVLDRGPNTELDIPNGAAVGAEQTNDQ